MKLGDLELTREKLAQLMDFSILEPDATEAQIREGCRVAKAYNFKGFHVNPYWAELVANELEGTGIETGLVVSFPFGANPTSFKVNEAKYLVKMLRGRPGVIDMVTNIGRLKDRDYKLYTQDIAEVAKVAHDGGYECKAILEVCFLTDDEVRAACECAAEAGADWVKTSTGRAGGPSLAQVKLMREVIPPHMKVKVAGTGGFFTPQVALACLLAGAERIGTRRAPWIVDELSGLFADLLAARVKG